MCTGALGNLHGSNSFLTWMPMFVPKSKYTPVQFLASGSWTRGRGCTAPIALATGIARGTGQLGGAPPCSPCSSVPEIALAVRGMGLPQTIAVLLVYKRDGCFSPCSRKERGRRRHCPGTKSSTGLTSAGSTSTRAPHCSRKSLNCPLNRVRVASLCGVAGQHSRVRLVSGLITDGQNVVLTATAPRGGPAPQQHLPQCGCAEHERHALTRAQQRHRGVR